MRLDQGIREAIGTAPERPLRHLSKRQLFAWPLADKSMQAHFAFTDELLARRGAYRDTMGFLEKAKDDLARAEKRIKSASSEADALMVLKFKRFAMAQLKRAEGMVAALATNELAISGEEVESYYRMRSQPLFDQMMDPYRARTLFKAQVTSWGDFLSMELKDRAEDQAKFEKLQVLASEVGAEKSAVFLDVKALYLSRIFPSIAWRRRFTDEKGNQVPISSLSDGLKAEYWEAWREWHRLTIFNDWIDTARVSELSDSLQEYRDQKAAADFAAQKAA